MLDQERNHYQLSKAGKVLFTGTANECFRELQHIQPFSTDYATKWGGYKIEPKSEEKTMPEFQLQANDLKAYYVGTYPDGAYHVDTYVNGEWQNICIATDEATYIAALGDTRTLAYSNAREEYDIWRKRNEN